MAKKLILALIILVIITFFAYNYLEADSVDIYIDGENVSVTTHSLSGIDTDGLNRKICDYTIEMMNDTTSNFTTYETGIKEICSDCQNKYRFKHREKSDTRYRLCGRHFNASNPPRWPESSNEQKP